MTGTVINSQQNFLGVSKKNNVAHQAQESQEKKTSLNKTVSNPLNSVVRNLPPIESYVGQPLNLNSKSNSKESKSKVAVIDNFKTTIDADYDDVNDNITHGEIVSSLIGNEDVERMPYQHLQDMPELLKNVRKKAENGENIAAVNISSSVLWDYSILSDLSGIEVTADNLQEKLPEIISNFREIDKNKEAYFKALDDQNAKINNLIDKYKATDSEANDSESQQKLKYAESLQQVLLKNNQKKQIIKKELPALLEMYDEVDKLSELGIPVVFSSGNEANEPDESINMIALNKKAVVIGATESKEEAKKNSDKVKDYQIAGFSVNNPLVDANMQGVYTPSELPDSTSNKLSKKLKAERTEENEHQGMIQGTSFSAPLATKYAKKMHDEGMSVDQINRLFAMANNIAKNANSNTEEVLKGLIDKYKTIK